MKKKLIKVHTIGFTKKSAEQFFTLLRRAGVRRVWDVRLNNVSQLAGFSKSRDLPYFLRELLGVDYTEMPLLAPTKEIRAAHPTSKGGCWAEYERKFLRLLQERQIEKHIDPAQLDGACLLCSEDKPDQCHRRLVVEYLQRKWRNLNVEHLV